MANQYGPRIITSGLVLCLDAANSKSYPGSGTLWYDLSGNSNHITLTNGPTYSTNYGGSIKFDGVDDFGTINSNSSLTFSQPTVIVNCTINTGTVLAKGGYGIYWNYGLLGLTTTALKARNNNGDTANPTTLPTVASSSMNFHAITYDGTNMNFYRNYSSGGSSSALYNPSATNSSFLRIGCAWNNATSLNVEFYSGYISSILIYNRSLLASEITQNFYAVKGRFGL